MHKRFLQFQAYRKRSRQIVFLFCLDLLFLIFALMAASLRIKYSQTFTIIFLLTEVFLLIITAMGSWENLVMFKDLEDYFVSKSYGTNAIRVTLFHKLLEENLFEYYFQPVINTKTGEIFAYEALMRTDQENIGMLPAEILDLAAKENRLYEIEKHTFFNILNIMKEYSEVFKTKKLFINSISSHQLSDEDFDMLYSYYGTLFENIVMEITEATYLDEKSLGLIHKRLQNTNCQLALDDYGTGYSNESNLLSSNPNYVKIDRTLLRYINIDTKKQHLVSNLVNFAKQHHIKVIAEGIECYEEFEYVINLGVDYIQGYYVAKPEPALLSSLPEDTILKIREINEKRCDKNSSAKIYETAGESILLPHKIASEPYTAVMINEKEITVKGSHDMMANLTLMIPDNHKCKLTFDHAGLRGVEKPAVILGNNCSVELILVGDNYISDDGIRVPETSDLTITGEGNLYINEDLSDKVGIGGNANQSYGNITLATTGIIEVVYHGNLAIGIGGGQNPSNALIRLNSGNISVKTIAFQSLNIGSMTGNGRIEINDCSLKLKTEGTRSVCLGSISGTVDIVTSGILDIDCEGRKAAAIGSIDESSGSITVKGGSINLRLNTHTGSGIGAISGRNTITVLDGEVSVYGEGTDLVGIGDHSNNSLIHILNGILSIRLYAGNCVLTGNQPLKIIIDGGNIQCDFPDEITPVNSYGAALVSRIITNRDEFSHVVETTSYSYEYKAKYSDRYPYIKVYLPENTVLSSL